MVYIGKFLSENTVIFDDFSLKMTTVRPKYVAWGSIQEGVVMTGIRYMKVKITCNWMMKLVLRFTLEKLEKLRFQEIIPKFFSIFYPENSEI